VTPASSLAVDGLSVGYAPNAPVVADIGFALAPGERLAIVGRSGEGKSTLLHALAGLIEPLAGAVLVDGQQVAAADWASSGGSGCRPGHAAYMFQRDLLLPWKRVLANVVFAAQMAAGGRARGLHERARSILHEFGLGSCCDALPAELSGGMRQRVALARTLVHDRGLVLLDEPFGSLDAITRADMHRWLLRAMDVHPATWVLVTHDVREAVLLGDHVAVLSGRPGRLDAWVRSSLTPGERTALAGREAGDDRAATLARAAAADDAMARLVAAVRASLRDGAGV
jgi:ABC-type nitrate/sulfonate/bicarbonate transport system ATPase subunit